MAMIVYYFIFIYINIYVIIVSLLLPGLGAVLKFGTMR